MTLSKRDDIAKQCVQKIRCGSWQPGGRLPSIRALADQHGCSVATMSGVLRQLSADGYLTSEARKGVFVAPVDSWGVSSRASGARLVGVMLSEVQVMLPSMEEALRHEGFDMLVRHVNDDLSLALQSLTEWSEMGVAGVLWSPLSSVNHLRDNTLLAEAVLGSGLPAVAVDRYPQTVEVSCVVSDNAQAGFELTKHLLGLGHRHIGLIRHLYGSTPDDRHKGYERALVAECIEPAPELVLSVSHQESGAALVELVRDWLLEVRPTAVWSVAGGDLGQALLAGAQAARMSVPEDVSIATFDGIVAPWPVTAMIQPFPEMARRAVQLLVSEIKHPSQEIHRIVLRSRLQIGESDLAVASGEGAK